LQGFGPFYTTGTNRNSYEYLLGRLVAYIPPAP